MFIYSKKNETYTNADKRMCAIFVDENGILLSVRTKNKEIGIYNCFIRELSFKGEIIKDFECETIGTIEQICRREDLVVSLADDSRELKVWDLKTGKCIRTLSKDISRYSKILNFFDLDKLQRNREDFKLISLKCPAMKNFTYDHHRILFCYWEKLYIIRKVKSQKFKIAKG